MDKETIIKFLGRPLTILEDSNFNSYLTTAKQKLETLLCYSIDKADNATYQFRAREGKSTVFTGAMRSVSSVLVNGEAKDYELLLWDNMNSNWYNSVIFNKPLRRGDLIAVTGNFGFDPLPDDLAQLLAQFFNLVSSGSGADYSVSSKRVEDFSITYTETSAEDRLIQSNLETIRKYSICGIGNIVSGEVCKWV